MKMRLSRVLNTPAAILAHYLQFPTSLLYVCRPLIHFTAVGPESLPDRWTDGYQRRFQMRFLGILPIGWQDIRIEMPPHQPDAQGRFTVRDNGRGHIATTWDHHILIEPLSPTTCRYTDEVEVRAGLLTPFIWLFARVFYGHRQRRWAGLVAAEYKPLLAMQAQVSAPSFGTQHAAKP